jgi:hypothetical protein
MSPEYVGHTNWRSVLPATLEPGAFRSSVLWIVVAQDGNHSINFAPPQGSRRVEDAIMP